MSQFTPATRHSGKSAMALAITIATQARNARRTAMVLTGGDYAERVKPWREVVRREEETTGAGLCEAVLSLLKTLAAAGKLDATSKTWVMAAFAEEAIARGDDTLEVLPG